MADGSAKIRLEVDAAAAKQQLAQTTDALKKTEAQAKETAAAVKGGAAGAKGGGGAMGGAMGTPKLKDGFDESTKSAGKLQEVMAKLFLPVAILGGVLKIVDGIDAMSDRARKFREALRGVTSGVEAVTAAMAVEQRGGVFGKEQLAAVQRGAAATAQVQDTLTTQLESKGRLLERAFFGGLFGAQSNAELASGAAAANKIISNQVEEQIKIVAAKKKEAEEKEAQAKKTEDDKKAQAEITEAKATRASLARELLSDEEKLNEERNRLKNDFHYKAKEAASDAAREEFQAAEKLVEQRYQMELAKLRDKQKKEAEATAKDRTNEARKAIEYTESLAKAIADAISKAQGQASQAADLGGLQVSLDRLADAMELVEGRLGRGGRI